MKARSIDLIISLTAVLLMAGAGWAQTDSLTYPVVDTGLTDCYSDSAPITCPASGEAFYGQDAQHSGNAFSYQDNGDGTVTDLVTGLMWQQTTDSDGDGDIDADDKMTHSGAQAYCEGLTLAGYTDWRLPDIKTLYSLIDFTGSDCSSYTGTDTSVLTPFIDNSVFDYNWGDAAADERLIDSQYASDTLYVGNTANDGGSTLFGVNFADGRIKGYGLAVGGTDKTFYCMCVRDNTDYGQNSFTNNGDGTITDAATGLMWAQDDSGEGLNWEEALAWVQTRNAEEYLGYGDWRLPNAKELQSIIDYTRSPETTGSAAIDPLFNATSITNEGGVTDYPYYWSGTTHLQFTDAQHPSLVKNAAYISFGRALGYLDNQWRDVHGAGAQRSDPKSGDPAQYPTGHGPQGDAIRIYNYVRLVRDADLTSGGTGSLTVTLSPQEAVDAGARWSIDNATWHDSGATVSGITAGSVTIYFSDVTGFTTPDNGTATVVADGTATASGTYTAAGQTTGLFINESGAYSGYTLFAPMQSKTTYLIDLDGTIAHTWDSAYRPGLSAYLLENGSLLRTGNAGNTTFSAGGAGGVVEMLDPDSTVTWTYTLSDATACLHHDVEYLPNGNVLMIAWEMKTEAEAIAAGRDPSLLGDGELWPDKIIEVNPATNSIVWEWRVWDHLIQDYDDTKPDYGVIADHPERIDLNHTGNPSGGADWTHFNSVEYISAFDQILVSVHEFSEIWVIDHSTTIGEAASGSGGNSGKGGDLLYRWGNPRAYGMGTPQDQKLYAQHDATWIEDGYPGSGNILIFNNGRGRSAGDYSSIEEITPPVDTSGSYTYTSGSGYGPDASTWTYTAPTPTDFYSENISGAKRLPNGNTLICEGATGTFFEVTSEDATVWKYVNPVTNTGVLGETDPIPTNNRGEQENQVFKVERYAPTYSGLTGIFGTTYSLSDAIVILKILVGMSVSEDWVDAVSDGRATMADVITIIREIAGG